MLCDSLGNPLRLILSPRNTHDNKIANKLIESYKSTALLADKTYNSQKIFDKALDNGMEIFILNKTNSKYSRIVNGHKYENRGLIENLFQRLKVFRRISTRCDKLDN